MRGRARGESVYFLVVFFFCFSHIKSHGSTEIGHCRVRYPPSSTPIARNRFVLLRAQRIISINCFLLLLSTSNGDKSIMACKITDAALRGFVYVLVAAMANAAPQSKLRKCTWFFFLLFR